MTPFADPDLPRCQGPRQDDRSASRRVNAVSRIHAVVSSRLVADQWPEIRPEENPVGFVTNGVHVPTFLHQNWADFFDQEMGRDWRERLRDLEFWNALDRVPETYKRYLQGYFRDAFKLIGTPLAIEFRTGRNPYAKKSKR